MTPRNGRVDEYGPGRVGEDEPRVTTVVDDRTGLLPPYPVAVLVVAVAPEALPDRRTTPHARGTAQWRGERTAARVRLRRTGDLVPVPETDPPAPCPVRR